MAISQFVVTAEVTVLPGWHVHPRRPGEHGQLGGTGGCVG